MNKEPFNYCQTDAYVLHSCTKEIDLDIGKKEESLSNYRATLAHKCCHSFKPNSHFAQFWHPMWVPTTSHNLLNSSTYPGTAWWCLSWRLETWSPVRRSLSPTTTLSRRRPSGIRYHSHHTLRWPDHPDLFQRVFVLHSKSSGNLVCSSERRPRPEWAGDLRVVCQVILVQTLFHIISFHMIFIADGIVVMCFYRQVTVTFLMILKWAL